MRNSAQSMSTKPLVTVTDWQRLQATANYSFKEVFKTRAESNSELCATLFTFVLVFSHRGSVSRLCPLVVRACRLFSFSASLFGFSFPVRVLRSNHPFRNAASRSCPLVCGFVTPTRRKVGIHHYRSVFVEFRSRCRDDIIRRSIIALPGEV